MDKQKKIEVEKGSGNVFADLGVPNPDAALAKAAIVRQIDRVITDRGLTQTQAGAILGVPQSRVSDLLRGRLNRFSLETLIKFANAVDIEIELRMKPSRRAGFKATTAKS